MPPVVARPTGQMMRSPDDPFMLARDLALGDNNDPVRIDVQADRPVRERSRHAVAVAVEVYEAGQRHPFGVFDEAVEGPPSIRSHPDSFSANGSSLLGRSGTLNFGSTVPARRYLRIVFRDKPVRRSISRIGIPSRKCQRRITLNNAMSITP